MCVDCVASAKAAVLAGASRLELCSALDVGGLTPSLGMLRMVKRAVTIPVYVMIRPRSGDFLYEEEELEVMEEDTKCLKSEGADGFVFGILKEDGTVDIERNMALLKLAGGLPVTLHRAVDMTVDLHKAVEDAIVCGFSRVLTSGGRSTAEEGASNIAQLVSTAGNRITIMPGCGINEANVVSVLSETGAQGFHCSGKVEVPSKMVHHNVSVSMGKAAGAEYSRCVSSQKKLAAILEAAKTVLR